MKEHVVPECPLCGGDAEDHGCYNVIANVHFINDFSPVRRWMRCARCAHVFARTVPEQLGDVLSASEYEARPDVNTGAFPGLGEVMARLKDLAPGRRLLDAGVGGAEIAAVALEFGLDVEGVEIRPTYARAAEDLLGVPVRDGDIDSVPGEGRFDVITLGDVIEHVPDPCRTMSVVWRLLGKKGVVWVSTPNHESAFSRVMKDRDPMWRVCEHLNYFSFRSLGRLLEASGFTVSDYRVSA